MHSFWLLVTHHMMNTSPLCDQLALCNITKISASCINMKHKNMEIWYKHMIKRQRLCSDLVEGMCVYVQYWLPVIICVTALACAKSEFNNYRYRDRERTLIYFWESDQHWVRFIFTKLLYVSECDLWWVWYHRTHTQVCLLRPSRLQLQAITQLMTIVAVAIFAAYVFKWNRN